MMLLPQLSLEEARTLRAIGQDTIAAHDLSSPRTLRALRGLASSSLIELVGDMTDPQAVRLTDRGHHWLAAFGVGIAKT
jgi:hypothetical protein